MHCLSALFAFQPSFHLILHIPPSLQLVQSGSLLYPHLAADSGLPLCGRAGSVMDRGKARGLQSAANTDEDIKSCLSLLPCHKGSLQRVALHGWYGRVFTPDALTNTIPKGICVSGWNLTSNFSLTKQVCQPNNIPLEAPSDYRHIIWEIWLSKSPKLQSVREYFEKSLIIFYLDVSGNLGSWCGR